MLPNVDRASMHEEAHEPIIVERAIVLLIEKPDALMQGSAPERRLVRKHHALCEQAFVGWLDVSDITDRRASFIDEDDIGQNDIGVGIASSGDGKGFESSGQIEIVGILPAYPVARSTLQPFVEGVHLAAIFLANPKCQAVTVAFEDLAGSICGATVDDDVFESRIFLVKNAVERLGQERCLIEGRRDDRQGREGGRRPTESLVIRHSHITESFQNFE